MKCPLYRLTRQKAPWISPAERWRTAALQDAAARTDASILTKLGKLRRGDIFVDEQGKRILAPSGAEYAAPTGLGEFGGVDGYKDFAPDGAAADVRV